MKEIDQALLKKVIIERPRSSHLKLLISTFPFTIILMVINQSCCL